MSVLAFLDREHSTAPPGYSRWLIPPAALAVHLCIGQVYATSVYKEALVAHFNTSLTAIGLIFSIAIVMLGVSAAAFGTWVERVGPRKTMFTSASCWSSGFLIAAGGIALDQLWLVYLGYGVVGGIGLGLGYISPVSTLIKWFPDRPGLATGLAIMGFGGGAMVASPLSRTLLAAFGGADAGGTAVMKLFITLGIGYFVFMMLGVFLIRVPAPDWKPADFDPTKVKTKPMVTNANVSAANAIKTPQFWLLWIVLATNVTAGIGILEQGSPMIQDFFRNPATGVSTVTAIVGAGFVGLLSVANMGGRFLWSTTSDFVGRKMIYVLYLGGGIALYLLLAFFGATSTALFVLVCCVIISFYGGGFATVPAYLRDLFGTFQVGAIHGRLLTAWSTAGIVGPLIVNGVLDTQGKPGELIANNYQPALLIMVGVLAIGFVANLLIRPVAARWHEPETVPPSDAAGPRTREPAAATTSPAAQSTDPAAAPKSSDDPATPGTRRYTGEIVITWTIVGIPMLYGLYNALLAAATLFTR